MNVEMWQRMFQAPGSHQFPDRNQQEFASNIHQALRGLCQDGLLGDAEMVLFYAFRDMSDGDLLAGT